MAHGTPRGTMVSTLHPETHQDFYYSQKRQAYGLLAAWNVFSEPRIGVSGAGDAQTEVYPGRACQQDARTRWFKAYAESRSDDARPDKDLILKHSSVHCKNFTIHKAIFDRIHHEYKVIEEGLRHEFRRTA